MIRAFLAVLLAATSTIATASWAAAEDLGPKLCAALGEVVPAVRGYQPEGVRAQLVMKISNDFDYDAEALRRVSHEIDAATTASCPALRTEAIRLAGTSSLSEAIR